MDKYIQHLNELFKNESDFNELYIDKIVDESYGYDTEMSNLFQRYNSAFWGENKILVSEEDYLIILKNLNSDDCIFIKAFEHYLIANSKGHYKDSHLYDFVNEYIDLYFANISQIHHGLPVHNLDRLLQWNRMKFPKQTKIAYSKIYSLIEKGDPSNIRYLSTAIDFIKHIKPGDLIGIESIYNKYMTNITIENKDVYFYYDCYKQFLEFFKDNKSIKKRVMKDLIDFSLNHAESFDNFHIQTEFQIIRNYMDELKEFYSDSDYNLIDDYLEKANKEALSKLQSIKIELPDEQKMIVDKEIESLSNNFESMDSVEQIDYLMYQTSPFSIKEIKQKIAEDNKSPFSFANEHVLDDDGRVINFDKMNENEEFSLKARWSCFTTIELYLKILYSTFLKHFKLDDCFSNYLKRILSSNKMISEERINLLYEQFIEYFKGDYRHSVFDIVSEFEESLRYYLHSCGLNIKKRNGSGDVIGINNIFNDYEDNSFRDKLLELIDEDYYFTFKWLLTDKYGFGLRDRNAHRIKATDLYRTMPAIYTALHIFRLYWFMQDSKH